jgi:alginate O-acetyltransferase complex protein AlgI
VVDVTTGRNRRTGAFITYIAMFPQLIAGPIVRYHEIMPEKRPRAGLRRVSRVSRRFWPRGHHRKQRVAARERHVRDVAGGLTTQVAWIGALAYAVQICFDFSGYSDAAWAGPHVRIPAARGLQAILGALGHGLLATLAYVAVALVPRLICIRWAATGTGEPDPRVRAHRVLARANWTFLVWGLYHGLWLERRAGWDKLGSALTLVVRRLITFMIVLFGWVIFRANASATPCIIRDGRLHGVILTQCSSS